jgi:hypothetical protein
MTLITIAGATQDHTVHGEMFSIEGSDEQFAVHPALPADENLGDWTATHVGTGFAFAHGDTAEAAIESARTIWLSKTPEQIAFAKTAAIAMLQARDMPGALK